MIEPQGAVFAFGENWQRFLGELDAAAITNAQRSLERMLGIASVAGQSFLDIGSGSGLFSLAARRLGARVHSFDSDPQSVDCAQALRQRFFPHDTQWSIDQASVLDAAYLARLGVFDIVYSWGVLHHTGALWQALDAAAGRVRPGGSLYVAIYNDQGRASRRWAAVKRSYNRMPLLRPLILLGGFLRLWGPTLLRDGLSENWFGSWRRYGADRGMSPWRDVVDWIGGWPFEVARPEEVFDHLRERGFTLMQLRTCGGGHGCNEFLFRSLR